MNWSVSSRVLIQAIAKPNFVKWNARPSGMSGERRPHRVPARVHSSRTLAAMNKRRLVVPLIWLIILMASASSAYSQQRDISAFNSPRSNAPGNSPDGAAGEALEKLTQDFNEALMTVQSHHVDGDQMNYASIFKSSINGML